MATRDCNDPELRDYLALPFVRDVPDATRASGTRREHWHIPDHADYVHACEEGACWAALFLEHGRRYGGPLGLASVVRAIAARHATLPAGSEATGYAVGFLNTVGALAVHGAAASGGALRYVDAVRAAHVEEREEHRRQRRARVATTRLLKRAARRTEAGRP